MIARIIIRVIPMIRVIVLGIQKGKREVIITALDSKAIKRRCIEMHTKLIENLGKRLNQFKKTTKQV